MILGSNSHIYFKTSLSLKKKNSKLNYFSPTVLRSLYLITSNPVHHNSEKKAYARGSCIPQMYNDYEIVVHKGKGFKSQYVNRWMVGFKFGEFTWNRKIALYKAKQKRKKLAKLKKKK